MSSIPLHLNSPKESSLNQSRSMDLTSSINEPNLSAAHDLHETSRQLLAKMLEENETLEYAEKPVFWKSNGPVFFTVLLGTIVFIILCIVKTSLITSLGWASLIAASFPVALIFSVYSFFSYKKRFVAFTSKRVIINLGALHVINYSDILELKTEINYLHCRKEIAIKKKTPGAPRPRVFYIDSIPKLEFYEQFLRGQSDAPLEGHHSLNV
eukprot:TRINITY_DN10512_c0_g1_i1.p1 TRINITY_DN10512_c0_g1~~TRINITY_DN10512_c0_g1_i1.p1  ORF type:complete len:211 (+),score=28.48 TRINITY_DN10512_c0_g1_i1:84-716(+)